MEKRGTLFFLAGIFVIVGILITLENFSIIRGISIHWPLFLLITGLGFMILFFQRNKTDLALLWIGSFVFILGIFFYYLNFTSWRRLSTLWPVYLGIVGFSFLSTGIYSKRPIFGYFAVVFIALFIVFTSVFYVSQRLWPMSFVIFGASLLILEYIQKKRKHQE